MIGCQNGVNSLMRKMIGLLRNPAIYVTPREVKVFADQSA